ncbi:MAG TPA: type II toxin-antitoxin system RelE/ParE family toxin [Anaeromyxobacteraceae bacterium]|nr:type II toxin-antitoxin system RelE/ParE family toxin [Anaeromyxobacteraceae bacterium]
MKVELSAEAQAQVERIDAWWRENRPAAPTLFAEELEQAIRTLAKTPAAAVRYAPKPGVRRLLLRRSYYHLYVVEKSATVYVVAVWNAFRGRGPRL